MKCPACGMETDLPVCPSCGRSLEAAAAPAVPVQSAQPQYNGPNQANPGYPSYPNRGNPGYSVYPNQGNPGYPAYPNQGYPVYPTQGYPGYAPGPNSPLTRGPGGGQAAVRRTVTSGLYLAAMIALFGNLLLGLILRVVNASAVGTVTLAQMNVSFNGTSQIIPSLILTAAVSGIIPLGMLLLYRSAKQPGQIQTAGLTMIKVMVIIGLVIISLFLAIFLMVLLVLLFNRDMVMTAIQENLQSIQANLQALENSEGLTLTNDQLYTFMTVIFIGITLALAVMVVYQAGLLKLFSQARQSIVTDQPCRNVTRIPTVFSFVLAGINLVTLFTGTWNFSGMLSVAVSGAALVLLALVYLRFRKESRTAAGIT